MVSEVGWEKKSGSKIIRKSISIFYFIYDFYFRVFSNACIRMLRMVTVTAKTDAH